MAKSTRQLADLHLHLYGSIDPVDYLDFLLLREEVDWEPYEAAFQDAYGERPTVRKILTLCRFGTPGAQEQFKQLFVFKDQDSGNFKRFQAKYNLLISGSSWAELPRARDNFPKLVSEVCSFMRKIVSRQQKQNIGYAEQRMMLDPSLSSAEKRELLLANVEYVLRVRVFGFSTSSSR